MSERHIVGLGGGGSTDDETRRLLAHVTGLARRDGPRVCVVPTAVGDDADAVLRIYGLLPDGVASTYLPFFPWPPSDLRRFVLDQDVIFVCGGNTANMLAVWRVHGFDRVLREACEAGSDSSPAVPARTTTARSCAGRCIRSSSQMDSLRASPPTTASASTSSGRSSPRW